MMRTLGVVVIALSLAACAESLTPAGQKVTLYRGDAVNLVAHCQKLGTVKASSLNHESIKHDLRNKAAALGGDSVAVVDHGATSMSFYEVGAVYKCGRK